VSAACAADTAETSNAQTEGAGGGEPQIIFVNFDGALISDCDEECSDAPTDRSWAISEHFGRDEMQFAPYTSSAGKTAIVAAIASAYSPYNTSVTTMRPAEGPYTMVIVSPTPGPNHGVAPLDCLNTNPNDIAFVYNLGSSAHWSAPQQIARASVHELGHSFGLEHVVAGDDFMQWASTGNAFTVSTYDYAHPSGKDCLSGDVQDAPTMLLTALGPAH
jgi:hypothetical protein